MHKETHDMPMSKQKGQGLQNSQGGGAMEHTIGSAYKLPYNKTYKFRWGQLSLGTDCICIDKLEFECAL